MPAKIVGKDLNLKCGYGNWHHTRSQKDLTIWQLREDNQFISRASMVATLCTLRTAIRDEEATPNFSYQMLREVVRRSRSPASLP